MPHEIWNSHGTGTNRLIKNGAILVDCSEDILQEFKSLRNFSKKLKDIQELDLNSLDVDYEIFESSKKSFKSSNTNFHVDMSLGSQVQVHSSIPPNIHSSNDLKSLSTRNKKELKNSKLAYIYDLISVEPISINELCKKTSRPISQISNDLFLLELEGYIKKVAGGYICILNK